MIRRQPRKPRILPVEVWVRIFSHLDVTSPRNFTQACRWFKLIADDPHSRCAWFINKYGKSLGLLHAFRNQRMVLTPEVGKLMVASGCGVPRFLVQWVDKEYHRPDRTRKSVSAALFVFFVNAGFMHYGANADFKEDDVARFERCVYSQSTAVPDAVDTIRSLIESFKFVPVRGFGSPIDETVYLVSKIDLKLVLGFIKNGLDLASVNDMVMERVLWRSDVSDTLVQSYLAVGFQLSAMAIKKGLQMARPSSLEVLRNRVSAPLLQKLAEETVFDMFGPSVRGWNFTPEALDFLMAAFPISEEVMEHAIFRLPGAPADLPDSFPATRCYMKANPCPAWRWILRTYGPSHRFTMACFDDALSRAAAERDLHALHDVYIEAGVQFRPRHVKILACRVLHRDMTANALHLLQVMRIQVTALYRDVINGPQPIPTLPGSYVNTPSTPTTSSYLATPPSSPILTSAASQLDATPTGPTYADLQLWLKNLREEITENEEWDHRMRTTQLEGGPRGGAYRISRAPEDATQFLDEAKEFVSDLSPPPPAPSKSKQGNGRFRASVVVGGLSGGNGRLSLERNAMSGGPASPGISRPIASMGRRQRGIVRRNSAPVAPTTPTAGTSAQNLVVTASTTTQTNVPEAAIAPAAEATDADDEDSDTPATGSDDVNVAEQTQPIADDATQQPTGPPPPTGTMFRRHSRGGSLPPATSRPFEGIVRRISSWWSTTVAGGGGSRGPHHPWDGRTAPLS